MRFLVIVAVAALASLVAIGQAPPAPLQPAKSKTAAAVPPLDKESQAHADLVIAEALGSKNPETRKLAAVALGLIGPREPYLTQLEAMLQDKDVYVRLAVVTSLVDLENTRTVPLLKKALEDEAPEVNFAAAKALWTLKDPEGRRVLLSVLSGDAKTSSSAFNTKKRDMLRMFHTPKTLFLFAMKEGAGMAPVPGLGAGISSLQELLGDAGTSGRATTALLLASDPSPDIRNALLDALTDKESGVRAAALHALAVRNDPEAMPAVLKLLADDNGNVRLRAAAAYLRLAMIPKPSPRGTRKNGSATKKSAPVPGAK